jgi:hypothetical protein
MANYNYPYEVRDRLCRFLSDKLREICYASNSEKSNWKVVETELNIGFFQGYKTESEKHHYRDGNNWKVYLNDNCYVSLFSPVKGRKEMCLHIFDISPRDWYCSENFFRKTVEELPKIASEFEMLKGRLEKLEKIVAMSQKSVHIWLSATMQNIGYEYYTTTDRHRVLLSVKMKRGVQLDIPIYFTKFQQIMPQLLEAIRSYEATIKENSIKMLISNIKKTEKWQQ